MRAWYPALLSSSCRNPPCGIPSISTSYPSAGQGVLDGALTEDPTCLIAPSDHPFIIASSYIAYSKWRYLTVDEIQRAEALGLVQERPAIAAAVLAGISHTPR